MTSNQAFELETLARVTDSSDADLICLARHCSANEQLIHFGQLTRADAEDMLDTLRKYRYFQVMRGERAMMAA